MDKHFEPVTARSLAEKSYELIMTSKVPVIGWKERVTETIEKLLEPHIRKPSDDDKSVPERCEEVYNEAISLLHGAWNTIRESGTGSEIENWRDRAAKLMGGPNPFKEADIVKEDETEPTLLPFSLEDAKNGAKVVTMDKIPVRIVEDNIAGLYPVLSVGTKDDGTKFHLLTRRNGESKFGPNNDLFILKEPEPIRFEVYMRDDGEIFVNIIGAYQVAGLTKSPENMKLIKTITTTI